MEILKINPKICIMNIWEQYYICKYKKAASEQYANNNNVLFALALQY